MGERRSRPSIELAAEDGTRVEATLECTARDWNEGGCRRRVCKIVLRCNRAEMTGEGNDYFEAFCRVREALSVLRLLPLCYGASRNAYPSAMSRDMGAGVKLYRLEPGRGPTLGDLVGIFATGPDVEPVSVAEQERFWRSWLESRGIVPPT